MLEKQFTNCPDLEEETKNPPIQEQKEPSENNKLNLNINRNPYLSIK